MTDVIAALAGQRVLGIVRAPGPQEAVDRCRALLAAGLHCIEIAFTTPGAAQAAGALACGIGTWLTEDEAGTADRVARVLAAAAGGPTG